MDVVQLLQLQLARFEPVVTTMQVSSDLLLSVGLLLEVIDSRLLLCARADTIKSSAWIHLSTWQPF